MKNKHILIIGGFLMLLVILFYWGRNAVPRLDYSKLISIPVTDDSSVDFNNLSPTQTVQLFILASKMGDENTVRSLITKQPDSYLVVCLDDQTQTAQQRSFPVDESQLSITLPSTRKVSYPTAKSLEKFEGLASCRDCPMPFIESRYIYITQNAFAKIKLTSGSIYQNEATVNVHYMVTESSGSNHIFLLANDNGWKVFATVNPELVSDLGTDYYQYYAKHRPLCKRN